MTTQKKVMKILVIIILAIFLLSSGLVSVMYFVSPSKNAPTDNLSGDVLTGDIGSGDEIVDLSSIGQAVK